MPTPDNLTERPDLPRLAIIVAMTMDRVIGAAGQLPWDLPDDLQLFKRLTAGGTIIMGRKTQASIGRPLPGRHNIVLSRTRQDLPGMQVCHDFMNGLTAAARCGKPVFVIGGRQVYSEALPFAEDLHISWIDGQFAGDVHFPALDLDEWVCSEAEDYPGFRYVHYRRKKT